MALSNGLKGVRNADMLDLRRVGEKFPPGTRIRRTFGSFATGTVNDAAAIARERGEQHYTHGGAFRRMNGSGRVYVSIAWDSGMKWGSQVEEKLEVIE